MSIYELRIAKKAIKTLQPNQYVSWPVLEAKAKELTYSIWGKMINEGFLTQGYVRNSTNRNYIRIANNPLYKLA